MLEEKEEVAPQAKRERSPSFPYLDLETGIEHLRKIYSAAKMNEVRQLDVAGAWGMGPKSGSVLRYISALGQYGLIETSGSGDQRRIKISNMGRRILEDERPGVREELKSEAALKSNIIRGLYLGEEEMPNWGSDRPSDNIAESSLRFDLNFGAEAARRFLNVYDATIKHIIDNPNAKKKVDNSEAGAIESGDNEPEPEVTKVQSPAIEEAKKNTPASLPIAADPDLNDIDFQKAGKGKIRISAVLDAEGLDLLEKQIAAFRMLVN